MTDMAAVARVIAEIVAARWSGLIRESIADQYQRRRDTTGALYVAQHAMVYRTGCLTTRFTR